MIDTYHRFQKQLSRLITDGHIVREENNFFLSTNSLPLFSLSFGRYLLAGGPQSNFSDFRFYGSVVHYVPELVDQLHEQFYPPEIQFLNGRVRTTFITNLLGRLQHSDELNSEIDKVTLDRATQIAKLWPNLSHHNKTRLSSWFSSEGEFYNVYPRRKVLDLNGEYQTIRIPDSEIILAHNLICTILGIDIWIKKSESEKIHSLIFREKTLHFCNPEFAFFKRYYVKCSSCGVWEQKNKTVAGLCKKCLGDTPKELLGYTERATSFFTAISSISSKNKYSSRLTGVELEYEMTSSDTEATLFYLYRNLKNHAIFKRDGSLTRGLEICTRPASIDIHLEQFNKMFNDSTCMDQLEVKSTCGMHVHIDRRTLSSLTIGKMIQFMQASHNKSFLSTIAERESNRFAILGTNHSITSFHTGSLSERYQGINLQNTTTIELRIFKTPNQYSSFLKNMEFVDALSSFVLPCNSGIKDTTYESFLNYVKNNRSTYKELSKFIKEKINA